MANVNDFIKEWLKKHPEYRRVKDIETIEEGDVQLRFICINKTKKTFSLAKSPIETDVSSYSPCRGKTPKRCRDQDRDCLAKKVFFRTSKKEQKQEQKPEYRLGWWITYKDKDIPHPYKYLSLTNGIVFENGSTQKDIGAWTKPKQPRLCESGYHASNTISQAMKYFSGSSVQELYICHVVVQGPFKEKTDDKFCGTSRKILAVFDGAELTKCDTLHRASGDIDKAFDGYGCVLCYGVWSNPDQSHTR